MKYITRFDYGNTLGWWVRIRRKSHSCSKLFSDRKFGGEGPALEAAVAWRDEMLRRHPLVSSVAAERRHKRVKTGVTGLYLVWPKRVDHGMPALGVSLIDQTGRHVVRSFSIRKWGLRKALWKACMVIAQSRVSARQEVLERAQTYYEKAYKHVQRAVEAEQMEEQET